MDTIFNVLVNISPVILMFLSCLLYKLKKTKNNKILFWLIIYFLTSVISGASIGLSIEYGLFPIAIINLFLSLIIYTSILILYGIKGKSLFYTLMCLIIIISILNSLFIRLIIENIIAFEFTNEKENKIIFSLIHNIINNEWVKGIIISALGGIIATLTTNIISKKK